jgi:hypothetical protein
MRARKNPPPFTQENLLLEMKPGRVYSPEAIALKFGISADAARARLLGAVMRGELREAARHRGFRGGFWVPEREPSFAARRVGALVGGGVLTGYTAELWRLHDLCMASRGQCHLVRYPPARLAAIRHGGGIGHVGDLRRNAAGYAFKEVLGDSAGQQTEISGGASSRNRESPSSNRYSPPPASHLGRPSA